MPDKFLHNISISLSLKAIFLVFPFVALPFLKAFSQSAPVGEVKDEQYRLLQLLSDSTIETSLSNRSIWENTYRKIFEHKDIQQYNDSWWAQPLTAPEKNISGSWRLGLYEPVFSNTVNSDLPYGGNNGSAWYGKGLNTELKAGFYITSKYFTATFRPHISYTQNRDFKTPRFIPRDDAGNPRYSAIFSNIDMPFRFGPDPYTNFNLGQTSIRLHYKNIEAGLSNETLWWGPGIQNALMLSNNAPGLRHAFFGTRAPLALPLGIGDLEFKFIWAEPKDSKYFETSEKTDHRRFGAGLNANFTPGFAPNLTIGLTRFSWRYIPEGGLDINDFGATLPYFNGRQNQNRKKNNGIDLQNQLVSTYFRWAFPESNAEIYGEYFREDSYFDLRDLFFEPDHDRAFTVGFQKVVESNGWFDLFKINGEINSLVPDRTSEVRPQTYFYSHGKIEQGHTNEGQILGAAIGPGSASQYLSTKGYVKRGEIGLFIQRVAVNDYFHFSYYNTNNIAPHGRVGPKDMWHHRINLNIGLNGRYKTGPLLLSGKIIWNKNYNYGRFHYGELEGINFNNVDKHDVVNVQFQLSARYYFGSNIFK